MSIWHIFWRAELETRDLFRNLDRLKSKYQALGVVVINNEALFAEFLNALEVENEGITHRYNQLVDFIYARLREVNKTIERPF